MTFWDALDAVGVDAYFPLAHSAEASREELEAGARRTVETLAAAAERFGKPIVLTELGYAARVGAWVSPHEEGGTFSEEHQALAYEVFFEALGRPAWLEGVYLWKVFSYPEVLGDEGPSFRFLGRRAEDVMRGYFLDAAR